ncbi:MAG TPA: tripartite tricarboxylate transporter permease [Thermodesulfobacteriota bacterium]|nr:tripartite tricarboxylate transporter permease [Thermodesulfobacteriota bacterium]
MEALSGLLYGLSITFQPQNLFFCFLGCFVGTLVGVLPGLGPGGALALLLPVTFALPPSTAIIMLAGIYYGAMYGGSTTSILINIPGEAASVVTCLDGYQMARKGRAGPALGMAAIASFIAGTISLFGLLFLAPPFANFALKFSSPEYVSLILCGLILVSFLGSGSRLKAFMMGAVGLLLGTIGTDPIDGMERFAFKIPYLMDGVGLIPVIMGLFGVSEIFANLEEEGFRGILTEKIKNLFPTLRDWKDSAWPIVRGTILGFFVGVIPGGNTVISSTMAYALEKKLSRRPEQFGSGVIEGVAAPESANNSGPSGSFIPLLSLGIPTNSTMALLLASLMIHGVTPGPFLITQNPDVFWSVIASMYVGNLMLLALNLPLVGLWVQVIRVPYAYFFPIIFIFCLLGSYSIGNTVFDIGVMIVFGIFGFIMKKYGYESTPLILAFILGPMFEDHFRRTLVLSFGSFGIFFERPISAVFLGLAILLLGASLIGPFMKKKTPAKPNA